MSQTATAASSAPKPLEQILGVTASYWQGRAVAAACELELADLLAGGPLHVDVLAQRTNTDSSSLFRVLRALESTGIFSQVSPRVFANSPASEYLRKDVPGSQWASIRSQLSTDGIVFEGYTGLKGSIETGAVAFEKLHGCSWIEFLRRNPEKLAIFNEFMRSLSAMITPAVTATYDWSRFPVIADIAGGIGTQLISILDAYPSCRGILFDLPEMLAQAIPHERVERIAGDFFSSIPGGADAYVLRWIIHDWTEPEAISILNNIRKAMKPTARVIVVESVVGDTPGLDLGKWMDVTMLVMTGGRERTAGEYAELYAKAGFDLEQIVPTPSPHSIIIGRPKG